jgi:hypothetical protein
MSRARLVALMFVLLVAPAVRAAAADRYALIVSGAAGSADYEQQYADWRERLLAVLTTRFGFTADHVAVLADASGSPQKPTRENVRAALTSLARRASKDDLVFIMLIGHGNASDVSADEAKFNLVGPDLSAKDWADLVRPIQGRIVFVNGASGSAPFLQPLSARGRVVITATDTTAQLYETVFPQFFIAAFTADEADTDKDGRVSVWEAFSYASSSVRKWYEQQGRLQTERALLDDNGDGIGKEAQTPGADGAVAAVTFFDNPAASTSSTGTPLAQRRAELQAQIDRLRARRAEMSDADYAAALERLLLELARVDTELRAR